jgi:hypothetical protein
MSELRSFIYLVASASLAIVISKVIRAQLTTFKVLENNHFLNQIPHLFSPEQLNHIPTVGPKGIFGFYYGGMHFVKHAREMVQEGYQKVRDSDIALIHESPLTLGE